MKKDRNCGMPYPMYPNFMPNYNQMIQPLPMMGNNIEDQINMINNKISDLERRISNLESNYPNSNNYNGYQMM